MSGDYSRQRFDPKNDFSGVFMQQGRVQLDADWNELVEILERRRRAETTDTIGRCVVPKETPDGFLIQITGGAVTIGRGRIYVDGLLAENEGKAPLEFDPVLAEERGTLPMPYLEQPYLPNAAAIAPLPVDGGPHLLYIDVWQREVSYLERPDLIEPAVGVDTTTRLQTVWQVRSLLRVGNAVTCATPDDEIPGWQDIIRPSGGRLTTQAIGVTDADDLCLIPPSGGYRGLENHLYRVEIHDAGPLGKATFKWSRDNASVATSVTGIPSLDTLTVVHTGRDDVLRFNPGDWVEVTDDWREFALLPGIIRQVKDVVDETQTITLTAPLTAGDFPTDAQGQTDVARHTRLRRWDQQGKVQDASNNLIFDLNAPGSNGVIPVPAAGASIILEDGVQITFSIDAAGGDFRVGDYWVFAARTADASVEQLQAAPPRGIHHHYGRLAIVDFPNNITDCRVLWPPEFGDESCACSVCVTAESHNSGKLTIQHAIDQVRASGGTVCLGVGQYHLRESAINIMRVKSVRVRGQGWKTQLIHMGRGPAIVIQNSQGITVEELTVITANAKDDTSPTVELRNCVGVTLQRDSFLDIGNIGRDAPAIGCAGILAETFIRENAFLAGVGVGNIQNTDMNPPQTLPLITAGFHVKDNSMFCRRRGVNLDGMTLHTADTTIDNNFINDAEQGGIVARGWVMPGFSLDVHHNTLRASADGIVVGTDNARISDNDIGAVRMGRDGDGIVLVEGLELSNPDRGLDRCSVINNRVSGVGGHGIAIRTRIRSAMIKQNFVNGTGGGGIVMGSDSSANSVHIESNQIHDVALRAAETGDPALGIFVLRTAEAAITNNTINGVGPGAVQSPTRAGIQVIAPVSVRISGNQVSDVGPGEFIKMSCGIDVLLVMGHLDVADNIVRRDRKTGDFPAPSAWCALRIEGRPVSQTGGVAPMFMPLGNNVGIFAGGAATFGIFGKWLLKLPHGREVVGVRGNHLETRGESPAVDISGTGSFVFSDNRCLLHSRAAMPTVIIRAGSAVVGNNYMQGPPQVAALRLHIPADNAFTALGNIASIGIEMNGAPLGAPWAPLNAIGS